jgi:hypothetical protein
MKKQKEKVEQYIESEQMKKQKEKVEQYIESEKEREKGHEDTRSKNFECDNPDPHLGCDLGIDVAG